MHVYYKLATEKQFRIGTPQKISIFIWGFLNLIILHEVSIYK